MSRSVVSSRTGHLRASLRHIVEFGTRRAICVIGVAAVALALLVAADIGLVESSALTVRVATVDWYVGSASVASTSGFIVHPSQKFVLSETCELFCYNFNGVTVSTPFHLVAVSIVNQPIQYTNITIQAPTGSYDGMLGITLEIGPLPGTGSSLA